MTTWHLDPDMARRYAGGGTAPAFAASVEQHLTGCPDCRALVPQDDARVDRVWAEVLDAVEAPRVGPLEAVLRRLGVSHPTARLVAATPTLRGAWLLASLAVVLLAAAAAQAGPRGTLMFVALAPVLPVLGVALAFGDRTDPTLEVAVASPYSLVRLLAARTSFVVATSILPRCWCRCCRATGSSRSPGCVPALAMCAAVRGGAARAAGSPRPRSPSGGSPGRWPVLHRGVARRPAPRPRPAPQPRRARRGRREHRPSPPRARGPVQEEPMTPTIEAHDLVRSYGRFRALDGMELATYPASPASSAPTAPGRRPCCGCSPPCPASTPAACGSWARTRATRPAGCGSAARSATSPRTPASTRGFTAFEAVDYVAVLKEHTRTRARHDEVRRVLGLVGLSDVATKKVRALSGGMRRRLGLAQALLGTPELLVLDEPTVGLDPEQRIRFRDLVSEAGHGRTVVLSTHQTEDVAAVCSHVVVVNHGQTLFSGIVEELTAVAQGRVWHDDRRDPRAYTAWRLSGGVYHHVGDPPPGAEVVAPAIEDAYLLLLGPDAAESAA